MAASLDQFKVVTGERSNYAKFDGLVNTVESSLQNVGDQSQNQWGTGLILAPSQLSQGGATTGQFLVWNGIQVLPTTVITKFAVANAAVVNVNNTAAETDLFTGNAPGATGGLLIPGGTFTARCGLRLVAGGTLFNSTGGSRTFNFRLTLRDSTGTFQDIWADTTLNMTSSANSHAWHLELSGQAGVSGGSGSLFFGGKFMISTNTAATAGVGALTTSPQLVAFPNGVTASSFLVANSSRLHWTITPETNLAGLGASLTVGRIEVTT